ncbi:MAG: gamma-glutamyltransferase [Gemmataceae bacterium]
MNVALLLIPFALAADRPAPLPGQAGRSVTVANHGMVATSHPLAAQIGLDILKSGGNAIDAAIATNAAMGLMEPTSNGIGGDLFAIVWIAKEKKLYGLNASGRAPMKHTIEEFTKRGLKEIPTKGPLSWSIPGCVDGWAALHGKFGSKPLADLLAPTIKYAEEGHPVPEVIAGYWRSAAQSRDPGMKAIFAPGGRAPRQGDIFKNPALANSLKLIARDGRDAFYKGEIADKLVALGGELGGLWTKEDFEKNVPTWVEQVSTNYRGYDVWELPPPGQGIAALQMLNLLEPYDLKKMGANSADYWHVFTEAKKLAFADRARFYTDPAFGKVPVNELISKPYAQKRGKLIDLAHAATNVEAGDPKLSQSDTIYLTVVDGDRNCVSLIQSNYMGFGSGHAHKELGFGIQNRGCLFSLDPNHANKLEGGKRPFHTIIPAMVTKDGKPWLTYGVMGGDMQPMGHVQILVNLIDFGMGIQAAGEAPRIEHVGSATPTGKPETPPGGVIQVEPGVPDSVVKALEKRGHTVQRIRVNGGGFQGIMIDPKTGVLFGGSEYRKDGAAVGW